jgi:hypothetical protein
MKTTIASAIIAFNKALQYKKALPKPYKVLNPYYDNAETLKVMQAFYNKYYKDRQQRAFIMGINPGRHGAGITGIPFTDTKRLAHACDIHMKSTHTHEISSVFIYDMIAAYGGVEKFYKKYFINSPLPLALIKSTNNGQWVNANYYDDIQIFERLKPFMIQCLTTFIQMGLDNSVVYVLGKKNAQFIQKLNQEAHLFEQMIVLDHPRYIQQYKSKEREAYIQQYLSVLH